MKQRRFFVDNLLLSVQLAKVSTRCSSHLQGVVETSASCTLSIKLSTKNLHCFYTATATENNVTTKFGDYLYLRRLM